MWPGRRVFVWSLLTMLQGCDDGSVRVCFGDAVFCALAFRPVANPGPDQMVAAGDPVTLDGLASNGNIDSYSWAQTTGPLVALANANTARAAFVAPKVVTDTLLTFRLTVVDRANQADNGTTLVTVRPAAAVALANALELLTGALQPVSIVASAPASTGERCPAATVELPRDQAAAQLGLWLAARALAIASGVDTDDPSAFLDASRTLIAERRPPAGDLAGQIESFGFSMLGALTVQRDPALHEAIIARQRNAVMLPDPAGLHTGRIEVRHAAGIAFEAVPDPDGSAQRAISQLLETRGACVSKTSVLDLTSAALRVIFDATSNPGQR